jgi:histidine phosphotransfer protein HptB
MKRIQMADPIDRDTLFERVDNDMELLAELVDIFEEDSAEHIEAIRAAVGNSDSQALERSAHSLKGSSFNLSANMLAERAFRLEQAGREDDLSNSANLLAELEIEYQRVIPALREIISTD